MKLTKDQLSDYASRISQIAQTFIGTSSDRIEQTQTEALFLIGAIHRQGLLLKDISLLLKNNPLSDQQSTLILCRCVIDDFLLILYLHSKDYDKEEFIKHTANQRNEQLKERRYGRDVNYKYFNGKRPNLFTDKDVKELETVWYNDPENFKYMLDVQKRIFKTFPRTKEMVESFPIEPMFAENAHSFYAWKYFSSYVHYSLLTFQKQITPGLRNTELEPIHETLTCSYKNIFMMVEALNKRFGVKNAFVDSTKVWADLVKAMEE